MESLTDTEWDVVLSGTDLSQSLLALALSRLGKRVLHLDRNDYYGGAEAALSLQEVESWVDATNDASRSSSFTNAIITTSIDERDPRLGFSRAYSISLSPQLVYTRSNLIPALVSSKVYKQLEFLAVGSWWIYEDRSADLRDREDVPAGSSQNQQGRLSKIPGGREDVFQDQSIGLKSTRSLMKFLKLAADAEAHTAILDQWGKEPLSKFLTIEFNIPPQLQDPLLALTGSLRLPAETLTSYALPRIHRHLTSIGLFGQGFSAVIPKWGGLAEIAQVACRAGAVGGGVYVLKMGIESIEASAQNGGQPGGLSLNLQGGEVIKTQWVIDTYPHLAPEAQDQTPIAQIDEISRSVTIISSALSSLFPPSSEGAPSPAGAVVFFATGSISPPVDCTAKEIPPIYLTIHSGDTGECPIGQCVIYAQISLPNPDGPALLVEAVQRFLMTLPEDPKPDVLWSLHYSQIVFPLATPYSDQTYSNPKTDDRPSYLLDNSRVIRLPYLGPELALEDSVLRDVKAAWERIVGEDTEEGFMIFEDREGMGGEDEGEDSS